MMARDIRLVLPLIVFICVLGCFFLETQTRVVENLIESATKYQMVLSVDFTSEGMRAFGERCMALNDPEVSETEESIGEEVSPEELSVE